MTDNTMLYQTLSNALLKKYDILGFPNCPITFNTKYFSSPLF